MRCHWLTGHDTTHGPLWRSLFFSLFFFPFRQLLVLDACLAHVVFVYWPLSAAARSRSYWDCSPTTMERGRKKHGSGTLPRQCSAQAHKVHEVHEESPQQKSLAELSRQVVMALVK
ncbi:hypothetical protein GGI43DRAFT_393082 [Trichoderma evansii]